MKIGIRTYPIAYVRQSVAGARDVIGSKIVRVEMCSEVDGSNKITSPLPLPAPKEMHTGQKFLRKMVALFRTKCDISVAHP